MIDTPTYTSLRDEAKEYLYKYWENKFPDLKKFVEKNKEVESVIVDAMAGFTLEKYTQLELMVTTDAESKK